MPRSLAIIVFLIIVVMAIHGAVLNRHQVGLQDEFAEQDRQAAEKAVRAKALASQATGQLTGAEIVSFGGAGSRQGNSYASLGATVAGGPELGSLFLTLYDADVGAVALTAILSSDGEVSDNSRSYPVIPLLVLARDGKGAFKAVGGDNVIRSPLFRVDGTSILKVALGVAYAASGDNAFADGVAGAAQDLRSSFDGNGLWAPESKAAASSMAYAQKLTEGRIKWLPDVVPLSIDMKDVDSGLGRKVIFKDVSGTAVGEAVFTISARPPLVAAAANAGQALAAPVGEGMTIGGYFNDNPDSLTRLLLAKPADLGAACRDMRRELGDKVGLGNDDADRVLHSLLSVHGLFAAAQDAGDCLGKNAAAAPPPFADIAEMNAGLGVLGAGARSAGPEKTTAKIAALFADSVAIYDSSMVWLGGTPVIPAATPGEAADRVMSLPVAHYACFSGGGGLPGARRAMLVRLENDPALWVLDAAFDGDGKVAGMKLAQAGQRDFCRAAGKQKTGDKACYFAGPGKKYPGVDPEKC
ncbi:MAG: hypothetical protein A3G18_11030 [Rhodospirillales bacterium RIFCSPLOWO2_12_FULL_58_28]|nr:MAG: hypothetical protein A3H92_03540 [Rhodospirillales bacterium RIFCSPLOWO2_02_FULL_58_16]OHC77736.1 MAG: hypothetical protein A3G18_11030 [Rhodospirillales bacterium RIFCSPLOWO2_12_FULL_58_28]